MWVKVKYNRTCSNPGMVKSYIISSQDKGGENFKKHREQKVGCYGYSNISYILLLASIL